MSDGVVDKVPLAVLEIWEDGRQLLHLRIPLPNRKMQFALAFIALVLLLRLSLVDIETVRQLLEALTKISTGGAP